MVKILKFKKCEGEGQCSCKRCEDKGKWNRTWCCFLYKAEGLEGCYCRDCVKEIMNEQYGKAAMSTMQGHAGVHCFVTGMLMR